jgi:hypothetical protein
MTAIGRSWASKNRKIAPIYDWLVLGSGRSSIAAPFGRLDFDLLGDF